MCVVEKKLTLISLVLFESFGTTFERVGPNLETIPASAGWARSVAATSGCGASPGVGSCATRRTGEGGSRQCKTRSTGEGVIMAR